MSCLLSLLRKASRNAEKSSRSGPGLSLTNMFVLLEYKSDYAQNTEPAGGTSRFFSENISNGSSRVNKRSKYNSWECRDVVNNAHKVLHGIQQIEQFPLQDPVSTTINSTP